MSDDRAESAAEDGQKSYRERVDEIRDNRMFMQSGFNRPDPADTIHPPLTTAIQSNNSETNSQGAILVCDECRDYWQFDSKWEYCPQCGSGLMEADNAE